MANEQYSKGGLFGAVVDYAGLDANTIAELSSWRWTASFTEYVLAGSQPATRMTYWLSQRASDYDNYPTSDPENYARIANFQAVTPEQTAVIQTAFSLVSSYTLLTFEAASSSDTASLRLARNMAPTASSTGGYPPGLADNGVPFGTWASGDAWLASNANVTSGYFGTDEFSTIIHEFGHTLGLKHGHETTPNGALAREFDNHEFSVLTYRTYTGSPFDPIGREVDGSSPQSYMMFDISALQSMYGANFSRLGKQDTYRWDGTSGQQTINGEQAPNTGLSSTGKIFSTVWTQGAAVTYDLSAFSQDQVDDLRPGRWLTFSNNQRADLNPADLSEQFKAQGNIYNALLYYGDLKSAIANLTTGSGNDTLIGNDRDNVLRAGDGNDIVVTSGGNDIVSGGDGADTMHFGPGHSTLRDSLADLNGDVVRNFGFGAVDVLGVRLGWDSVTITATQTMISFGTSAVQLDGSFAGNGAFILSARGLGADAHTALGYVNYLPSLAEGVSVDTASINGVADQSFLIGDGSARFTLEFKSAVSAFANTLGAYKIKADGTIDNVLILFDNTLNVAAGARIVDLGVPANGERIGFFLIQNGFEAYGDLPDSLAFLAPGTGQLALVDSGAAILTSTLSALTRTPIFHSTAILNPNGANQVLSGVTAGGQQLQIGFEDLASATGDRDFQDVVIGIHVTGDGFLFT
ncbi:MAG TPA: DUF4114 domain-containing protein [Reyranella sp.]|nr:DUF4114 domain-containing protein [Reyranella sp.]